MTLLCRDTSFLQFTPSITQYLNDDDRFLMLKSKKKKYKEAAIKNNKKVQEANQGTLSDKQADRVELISKSRINDTYSDDESDSKILSLLSEK